ncbi:MAG: methyltransferase domain-containing protein [Acidimicrobiales bacterium]
MTYGLDLACSLVTKNDRWDPAQYNRFASERELPFWDLVNLIQDVTGPSLIDLGCGDGRLTSQLAERFPDVDAQGIDSSPAMIARAREFSDSRVRFYVGDIASWEARNAYDIIFANASLQWIPDHLRVLSRLTTSLRAGGQLAFQVPANADHPSHVILNEVAHELIDSPPPDAVAQNVLNPEIYAETLDALDFAQQHVRLQVYTHRLTSSSDVVEWMKGTSLTRFKSTLSDNEWNELVDAYARRLRKALGDQSPYLYVFKRILVWARRDE